MRSLCPTAKVVIMLRNPIERAWSHYRFSKRNRPNQVDKSDDIIRFLKGRRQIMRSDYVSTINNYLEVYPKDQLIVGFYDAIKENPQVLLSQIINHIVGENKVNVDHLDLQKVVGASKDNEYE